MNDTDSVMSSYERHRQARAKLSKSNKRAVFEALAAANITEVHVDFDGEGDSGQIGSVITFLAAARPASCLEPPSPSGRDLMARYRGRCHRGEA